MLIKSGEKSTSVTHVKQLVEKYYGIQAIAKPLPGEIDDNFYLITNQGEEYVLKIAPPDSDLDHLKFQNALALHLKDGELALPCPVKNMQGDFLITHCEDNHERYLRLFSWLPGRLLSQCHPHGTGLLVDLGKTMGKISKSLQHFDHPYAHRFHKWDPSQADWVKPHLDSFEGPEKKEIAAYFYQLFEGHLPALQKLRKGINHNDANDHNVIVTNDSRNPRIYGLIDYGDAIYTHTINELAITLTYSMMGKNDPLEAALAVIKGYHREFALMEEELAELYVMIGTRLLISVTVAHLNSQENPDNPYLQISNPNAWNLLRKWKEIPPSLAHYSFRYAAGFESCPLRKQYETWLNQKPEITPIVKQLGLAKLHFFDLGIGSLEIGNPADFSDTRKFEARSIQILEENKADIGIGKYGEVRPIYTAEDYLVKGNSGYKWRTVHLGIDIFVAPDTGIFSPLNGVLNSFQNNAGDKNYGPTIILE
ncbi:MAG: phosphotransferase, partial [Bacteroidetes bacterium]|nr:phosphotransferase [Bacteroidota bacterium]